MGPLTQPSLSSLLWFMCFMYVFIIHAQHHLTPACFLR